MGGSYAGKPVTIQAWYGVVSVGESRPERNLGRTGEHPSAIGRNSAEPTRTTRVAARLMEMCLAWSVPPVLAARHRRSTTMTSMPWTMRRVPVLWWASYKSSVRASIGCCAVYRAHSRMRALLNM